MPTVRVCVTFNSAVNGEPGWLKDNDATPKSQSHVFAVRCEDIERGVAMFESLSEDNKRWFHFEFWREDDGVEQYSRIALFGLVKKVDGERRFFIQRLSADSQKEPESLESELPESANSQKDLESLESELREKAEYLGGGRGAEIKADMSWNELAQGVLCPCFTNPKKDETTGESHERLQSLSKARPVGRIYFMYCFSLDDYFRPPSASGAKEFTEAEKRKFEKDIFYSYMKDKCQLKEKVFRILISKEENLHETHWEERWPVLVERREGQLKHDGVDFSIFRTKLKSDEWLNDKTYRVKISETVEYFLRLSRTGLIEVRQEVRLLGEEQRSLAKILEGLLRFRRVDADDENDYTNMSLELNRIVEEFAKYVIEGHGDAGVGFESKMNATEGRQDDEHGSKKIYRDRRYVVIVLRDLKCGNPPCRSHPEQPLGLSIKPSDVSRNIEVVSSFLEGTMTYDEKSNKLQIPGRAQLAPGELPNLSTWSEEICFFESDRSLIYFEPKTILETYNHVANYEAYWRAIVRGVEHQLSIRTCLQKMETTTTKLTEKIPALLLGLDTQRPGRAEDRAAHEAALEELASNVSEVVSWLPKLRQISTTATAFRSGKAIGKFDRLGRECFQFPELVRNIQQNVNELGDFLQYAKAQELRQSLIDLEHRINAEAMAEKKRDEEKQRLAENAATDRKKRADDAAALEKERADREAAEERKRDIKTVQIGVLLAASSIFFASFSLLNDADEFFTRFHVIGVRASIANSTGTKAFLVYATLCLILVLIMWQVPKYVDWKLQEEEAKKEEEANKKKREQEEEARKKGALAGGVKTEAGAATEGADGQPAAVAALPEAKRRAGLVKGFLLGGMWRIFLSLVMLGLGLFLFVVIVWF